MFFQCEVNVVVGKLPGWHAVQTYTIFVDSLKTMTLFGKSINISNFSKTLYPSLHDPGILFQLNMMQVDEMSLKL
ncbi:MAG TPA: hypothetical protein VI603_03165 [Saprospiraceae bacterium]|nr:hypothetical protein [Saprospiraceae bacterium]